METLDSIRQVFTRFVRFVDVHISMRGEQWRSFAFVRYLCEVDVVNALKWRSELFVSGKKVFCGLGVSETGEGNGLLSRRPSRFTVAALTGPGRSFK